MQRRTIRERGKGEKGKERKGEEGKGRAGHTLVANALGKSRQVHAQQTRKSESEEITTEV